MARTQTYQYDGFGNLTAKVLNGTTTAIAVNAATNQLTNAYYYANGNMTSGAGGSFSYDEANRLVVAQEPGGGSAYYAYNPSNKRVYQWSPSAEEFTFYGAYGEKLGMYAGQQPSPCYYYGCISGFTPVSTSMWFAGRLLTDSGNPVVQDRLGTNRVNGARFMPYGDEITSTSNDREKFATYTRDSYTGLDYADQRFYASTYGRFNTPDSFAGSEAPADPGSWNRYSYTLGDPINNNDPQGMCAAFIGGIRMGPSNSSDFAAVSGSIGAVTAFPYAGQNGPSSVASVISQGIAGPNLGTAVALAAIQFALNTNPGMIDIVAYSGGAAAFTDAYGELSGTDQQRIGNILYISPGAAGGIVANGSTSVVLGSGPIDNLVTIGTYIPPGTPISDSNCAHTDFTCLAQAAQSQLNTIQSDGACSTPTSFSLAPNTLTGIGGGITQPTRPSVPIGRGSTLRTPVVGPRPDPTAVVTTTITYDR